ncbi:TMEM175 family protein [Companilactobacillus sp. DQM5]|uniref:TMEM175 family protein n=1 Tax=Companilactobacillus sp. DQM5 TaxID=3463359 RepID=UPI0040596E18
MSKARLEAFTDGVMAIILTILVLDLKAPDGDQFENLLKLVEPFCVYVISFVSIAIYWNNHHHLLQATKRVSGKVLWANINLLFWLSLVPFATSWVGNHIYSSIPEFFYALIFLMASIAYYIFNMSLISVHEEHELITKSTQNDNKIYYSMGLYILGVILAFILPILGMILSLFATMAWLIPNKKIEKNI